MKRLLQCVAVLCMAVSSQFALAAARYEDPHSYANTEAFAVQHLALDLNVDFKQSRLAGTAELTIERLDPHAKQLVLDTRDLTIERVSLVGGSAEGTALKFSIGTSDPVLGAPMTIDLPQNDQTASRFKVRLMYQTSPEASGLQWVEPSQTAGKKHPFLYTQSQAVHARSWIPLQDTPAVRQTYSARIRTPKELRAVMSAANDPNEPRDGDYSFEMPQPVPSYLIALGVGDVHFQAIGPRTGVFAEKPILGPAANEFSDVEQMLIRCEQMFGAYQWGRYDLLMLPPSFPWGGMENPRLSFITPTVIAGDKSLTALIAHELAHSWSGNLVTNASWRDTWLNEGFTTYLERRIVEEIYGPRRYAMEDVLALQSVQRDIKSLTDENTPQLTHLAMELKGRDPDDAFSDVSYEKGRLFVGFLESRVGRERLDRFLQSYFKAFSFKSVNTEQFRDYLNDHLVKPNASALSLKEVDEWIYGPGLPKTAVLPTSDAFEQVELQTQRWLGGEAPRSALKTDAWTTHEWLHFLENLPTDISAKQLGELDAAFKLTQAPNNEIAHSWLKNVIRAGYQPGYKRLEHYLTSIGRRKLVRPLYDELLKTPDGKKRAQAIYAKARPLYHVTLRSQLEPVILDRS